MNLKGIFASALALVSMAGVANQAQAQSVSLKCMQWNIKSFEYVDKSNEREGFKVDKFVEVLVAQSPDVVVFNEFETANGRMSSVEKLTEISQQLGMFPYVVFSYDKDNGVYGNGIMSKYPILDAGSTLLGKHSGPDQRSIGWVDVWVPTTGDAGQRVRVAATHLEAFSGTELSGSEIRLLQAKESIAAAIQPALDANIPVILMGDLNAGPSSSAIAEFEILGDRLCDDSGTFGGYSKLDYIVSYPKAAWSGSGYAVVKGGDLDNISDHYPIVVTATLNN